MIDDPIALGLNQARTYWSFLFAAGVGDDIRQEICIANLEVPLKTEGPKKFALCVNRRLYHLARAIGFRKRHRDEGKNQYNNWWERKVVNFTDLDWIRRVR